MEVTHLRHVQPTRRYRSLGNTADWTADWSTVDFDALGINPMVRLVPVLYHTALSDATWEVFAGPTRDSTLTSGAPFYYSGTLWRSVDCLHLIMPAGMPNDVSLRRRHDWLWTPGGIDLATNPFLRIKITDPSNTAGFIDIGGFLPDSGYQPSLGIAQRPTGAVAEEARRTTTTRGVTHPQIRPRMRTRQFVIQAVGDGAQVEFQENVLALEELRGVSESVTLVLDPEISALAMNYIVYGLLDQLNPVQLGEPWHMYECPVNITELL